jgi:hypothetical protein
MWSVIILNAGSTDIVTTVQFERESGMRIEPLGAEVALELLDVVDFHINNEYIL